MRNSGKTERHEPTHWDTVRRKEKAQAKLKRLEQRNAFQCAARGCDGCILCEQE